MTIKTKTAMFLCLLLLANLACNSDYEERRRIAKKITNLKELLNQNPSNEQAKTGLLESLASSDRFEATYACSSVRGLKAKPQCVLESLIDCLNCGDRFVEREAAISIASYGPKAEAAVSALEMKVENCDTDAAFLAAEALGEIGVRRESTIKVLEKGATSNFEAMKNECIRALKKLSKNKLPNGT